MAALRKYLFVTVFSALLLFGGTGCFSLTHVVGEGAQGRHVEKQRQWYALWGLVRLNTVDSHELSGGAIDYTVHSKKTPLDALISLGLSPFSVQVQTVVVEY